MHRTKRKRRTTPHPPPPNSSDLKPIQPVPHDDLPLIKALLVLPHNQRRVAVAIMADIDWILAKPDLIQRLDHRKLMRRQRQRRELGLPLHQPPLGPRSSSAVQRGGQIRGLRRVRGGRARARGRERRAARGGGGEPFAPGGQVRLALGAVQVLEHVFGGAAHVVDRERDAVDADVDACFAELVHADALAAEDGLDARVDEEEDGADRQEEEEEE